MPSTWSLSAVNEEAFARAARRGAWRRAALLVDEVLPEQSMRQWVLSFPFQLRFLFASRPEIMAVRRLQPIFFPLADQFAEQAPEFLLFLCTEYVQFVILVFENDLQGLVQLACACTAQAYQLAAPVVRIGWAVDPARFLQPVENLGQAAGAEQQRTVQLGRGELPGLGLGPQRGQHVEIGAAHAQGLEQLFDIVQ